MEKEGDECDRTNDAYLEDTCQERDTGGKRRGNSETLWGEIGGVDLEERGSGIEGEGSEGMEKEGGRKRKWRR